MKQNVVVVLSASHGITLVLQLLEPYSEAVDGSGSRALDPVQLRYASRYMNQLSLDPPFAQTIMGIYGYLNESTPTSE